MNFHRCVVFIGVREEFARQTAPYRTELLAYCYRMLGTVHDAEDLLQETMLRAWRGFPGFRGQASLRTWLYRIATNACLNALERRDRRPQPAGLELEEPSAWVEPFPDRLDPAAVVIERDSMRLAMVAALQYLAPRQRAVLLLRD
ncbi:MAG: sigma-70 family RNA polymerase sigma factor, partial [Nonomuraea sp.]|nr:sigma-70 family RNA polymerase sigma factor [Nonomuraea sp.]